MATTIRLDGSEWQAEVAHRPKVPSFSTAQRRAELRAKVGPSALLATAAIACTASIPKARVMLRNEFEFPKARAIGATKVGVLTADSSGLANAALGYLAGVKMSARQASTVLSLLTGETQVDGASSDVVSDESVTQFWHRRQLGRLARQSVRSDDRPSQAVCAALLASRWDDPRAASVGAALAGGLSETFMGPRAPSQVQLGADRVLAAAYAMSALSPVGLDLGSETWAGASADWRFRAAPWVLALLDDETSPALVDLLSAASARGLGFVRPGQSPFPREDSREVTEDARNLAVGSAAKLTKWTDWPTWFSDDQVQVLLTQDEDYAYAWVGRHNHGQLVAFDTTDFIGWGLDEPGMVQALAYAIGWYVDVSISLRASPAGTTTVRRTTGSSRVKGISYKPTAGHTQQRSAVAAGTHAPPAPHMRAAHVRDLVSKNPSAEALSHAPVKYRRQMGPHETWIRSAEVGSATARKQMEHYLSKNSALAVVLGSMGTRFQG